jgi:solute carrier family 8 (sodium/calcium exchanger)
MEQELQTSSQQCESDNSIPTMLSTCTSDYSSQSTQTPSIVMINKSTIISQKHLFLKNACTQTTVRKKEIGLQTNISFLTKNVSTQTENEYQQAASTSTFVNDADDDIESVISEDSCDSNESDCTMYEPSEHETSADESDISSNNEEADENNTLQESRKFIVFESTLLMLFTVCQLCQESAKGVVRCVIGTMIIIEQLCVACGHRRVWHSQPYMGRSPAGNILLSAAILFTGSSVRKAIRLFNQLNVCTITSRTFFRHQTKYLQPSIISYWKTKQSELIDLLRNSD